MHLDTSVTRTYDPSNTSQFDCYYYIAPCEHFTYIPVPNNWQWFDVFRNYIDKILLTIAILAKAKIRRVQEKSCLLLRKRDKRKKYIQNL